MGATAGVSRAARPVIIVVAATQYLQTIDLTVMNVSMAPLIADLGSSVTDMQMVIAGYALVMAMAMITGAKVGDIIGRRRALRIGLVLFGIGSGVTAVAQSTLGLLVGWSVLEGLGSALIMPALIALLAGNLSGRDRAYAYSMLAVASAVGVASGPIVGGFITAAASWRLVFGVEVIIVAIVLVGTRLLRDVPARERPKLDLVGAALSALGLGLIVWGLLEAGSWGLLNPKVPSGPDATPQISGVSLSAWLVLAGVVLVLLFAGWIVAREARGRSPLVDPRLFRRVRLLAGLGVIGMQYLIKTGVYFTVPLFLSIVLGLDAFETGLRLLPLSLSLVIAAPAVPRFWPSAGARKVVLIGLLFMLAATTTLAALLGDGAGPWVTFVPFVFLGIGLGAVSSQVGNVIVSAVPPDRSSEAGGLQYTSQNLGAAIGTALVGSMVIASLASLLSLGIGSAPDLDDAIKEQAAYQIDAGVDFMPVDEVAEALAETSLSEAEQATILDTYRSAQLGALARAMMLLSLFVAGTLFIALGLPRHSLITGSTSRAPRQPGPAIARGGP